MTSTVCAVPDGYPSEIIGYAEPWIVGPGDEVAIKVLLPCVQSASNEF